jgi:NAD(P)H-hydrate epimerase
MVHYLNRRQSRQADERAIRDYKMLGLVLMENAGRGCADLLEQLGIRGPVVICCGKGNNGGDGFVVARHLEARGHDVRVLLCCDPEQLTGDAGANYRILEHAETPRQICSDAAADSWIQGVLCDADWIVDALLGTGATGSPRSPLDRVIDLINQLPREVRRLAIDLPSGLDCDTGIPSSHTVRADHTATFVAPKVGFQAQEAQALLGRVHVLDIGAPRKLMIEVAQ